jgi:hypothetical protein
MTTERIETGRKAEALARIRHAEETILAAIARELPELKAGKVRIKYDLSGPFTFSVDLAPIVGGTVVSRERVDFRQLAPVYGLRPEDLDAKVAINGTSYTIDGLLPRASKFNVLLRAASGKRFKFSADAVQRALGHPGTEARR